jgi:hypothetical protein
MRCAVLVVLLTLLMGSGGCGLSTSQDFEMPKADPTIVTSAFDPETVQTFEGQIVGIERVNIEEGDLERPAMIVRFIGNGDFPKIYLGPTDFIGDHDLDPQIMNYAEVVASRVNVPGLDYVARELKIGDKSVVLRDGLGSPYWHETGRYNRNQYHDLIRTLE